MSLFLLVPATTINSLKPDNRRIHMFIEKTKGTKSLEFERKHPNGFPQWNLGRCWTSVCESVPNVLRYDGMRIVGLNTCLEQWHLILGDLNFWFSGAVLEYMHTYFVCVYIYIYIWFVMDPAKEGLHKPSTCSSLRCKSILKTTCTISDV